MTEIDWPALRTAAREAMTHAYAPYSKFPVGVAGLVDDGRVVTGCNVENASYGLGLCAECGLVSELQNTGGGRLTHFTCVDGHVRLEGTTPFGSGTWSDPRFDLARQILLFCGAYYLYRLLVVVGESPPTIEPFRPLPIPLLSQIPFLGEVLFTQTAPRDVGRLSGDRELVDELQDHLPGRRIDVPLERVGVSKLAQPPCKCHDEHAPNVGSRGQVG